MTAPTYVGTAQSAWTSSTSPATSGSITVQTGDLLVAIGGGAPDGFVSLSVSNSGAALTWTQRASETYPAAWGCAARIWTAVADDNRSLTVSVAHDGTGPHGVVVTAWRNAGVGAAVDEGVTGAPSTSITTGSADSAVVVGMFDRNGLDYATRTWATVNSTVGTELVYSRTAGTITAFAGYWPNAGTAAAKTVGVTESNGVAAAVVALEITYSASVTDLTISAGTTTLTGSEALVTTAANVPTTISTEMVVEGAGAAAITVAAYAPTVTPTPDNNMTVTVPAATVDVAGAVPSVSAGDTPAVTTGAITARVEIEFSAGVWTDVSAYARLTSPMTITAGRSDTDERVQPGRLSGLVLHNNDGRFTVGNAAGAYYPNVVSGRRVRVSILDPVSSAYVPRFTGRIDGWPLSWGVNGTPCTVTISATDMLTDWAQADMPSDFMYQKAVAAETASGGTMAGYWECTSIDVSGNLPARRGGALVTAGSAPTTLTGPALPGDPKATPDFPGSLTTTDRFSAALGTAADTAWMVSAMFRVTDPPASGTYYYPVIVSTGTAWVAFRIDSAGDAKLENGLGVTITFTPKAGPWTDGSWHHLRIAVATSGAYATVYWAVDNNGGSVAGLSRTDYLCSDTPIAKYVEIGRTKGSVAHVSWWTGATTPTNPTLASPAGGLAQGYPSTRLGEIATLAGLTTPAVVGDERQMVAASTPFGKALDLVPIVEDTELGVLWCDGDGTVTYTTRAERTETPTLAMTLTAAEVSPDVIVAADRVNIANEVQVVNTAPLSYFRPDLVTTTLTVSDATSKTIHGRRSKTVQTAWFDNGTDPGYLTNVAASRLITTEAPRIPTLPLNVLTMTDAQQSAVLAADMWDQIAVTGLPTAGGWDTQWLGRIEGWTETVGAAEWRITFNTSFAGNRLGDATFGLILGSNRLG